MHKFTPAQKEKYSYLTLKEVEIDITHFIEILFKEYEKQDDILGRVLLNNEIIHTISWFEGFYTGKTGRVSDWGANQYRKFSDLITKMILNETTAKDNSKTKENYPSPFSEN